MIHQTPRPKVKTTHPISTTSTRLTKLKTHHCTAKRYFLHHRKPTGHQVLGTGGVFCDPPVMVTVDGPPSPTIMTITTVAITASLCVRYVLEMSCFCYRSGVFSTSMLCDRICFDMFYFIFVFVCYRVLGKCRYIWTVVLTREALIRI